MGSSRKGKENRDSFRCRIFGPRQAAELRVGEHWMPVRLYDESATGYAIILDGIPQFGRDDVLQLRMASGVCEVRVANVQKLEAGDPSRRCGSYRIGLRRLGEAEEEPRGRLTDWIPTIIHAIFPRPEAPMFIGGLILALVAVAVPLAYVVAVQYLEFPESDLLAVWQERVANRFTRPAAGSTSVSASRPVTAPSMLQFESVPSAVSANPPNWATALRLPGASGFLTPMTIRELKLTEAQQQQIRRIVEQTAEAFRLLDTRYGGASRHHQSQWEQELLEAARKEAIDLLTPEQRRRFHELLEQSKSPQARNRSKS